jgi:uncharacterized protein YhbP (UPF0306 family)
MNDDQITQAIKDYLPSIIHMSLATIGQDGKPWTCDVHYAYDDDLNLYWVSVPMARHSQDIAVNPHVAGTIVTQHMAGQAPLGVSFEGTVEILQDVDDNHPAFKTYIGRFPDREQAVHEAYVENAATSRRIYKVTVSDWYLNGLIDGKMDKLHLAWK